MIAITRLKFIGDKKHFLDLSFNAFAAIRS